jgi:peptide-methionine (S)-S-oxide reductase
VSGYAGGSKKSPTYEEVGSGSTGHAESVKVTFDPAKISYAKLLEIYWHNIDPFSAGGQFCDRGNQYRSAIFYADPAQKKAAEESKRAVEKQLGKPVVTEIVPAGEFWPAEEYHQDFYKKNPARYYSYRAGCGRDARLKEVWGERAGGH